MAKTWRRLPVSSRVSSLSRWTGHMSASRRYGVFGQGVLLMTCALFICSGRQLTSARRHGVFGYPKQSATVSVGSVLKWRARPQRRHAQCNLSSRADEQGNIINWLEDTVFSVILKTEPSVLKWRARSHTTFIYSSKMRQVTKTRCQLSWTPCRRTA
jgi:hypothetical protein